MEIIIQITTDELFRFKEGFQFQNESDAAQGIQNVMLEAFGKKIKDLERCPNCGRVFKTTFRTQQYCCCECKREFENKNSLFGSEEEEGDFNGSDKKKAY